MIRFALSVALLCSLTSCDTFTRSKGGSISYTEKPKSSGIERKFEFSQPEETSQPTTIQILTNGTATVSFGANFDTQATKSAFGAFRPYHIAGIFCVIAGGLCLMLSWTSSKVGWSIIALGGGLSIWATVAPQFSQYLFYVVVAIGTAAAGYILWRHGKGAV